MSETLKRSKDRKVATDFTNGGGVRIANSFGLPAGKAFSCPGATTFCESICYAGKLEKIYKGAAAQLLHNFNLLRNTDLLGMVELLDEMIIAFDKECVKWNAVKAFRIHWDGDFFSTDYAQAWAVVIHRHPDIQFWAYTRVESAARYLFSRDFANLSLYFSADPDNIETAHVLKAEGILIAYVDKTFAQGKEQFDKATRCPENNKAIKMVGACFACGLCIKGRKDVLFSVSKK